MFNIDKYLEKFSKSFKDAEKHKTKIIEIIEKNTQLYIPPKYLEIRENIIYIQESPVVKNKLFIYKDKILEEISKETPLKIIDIR